MTCCLNSTVRGLGLSYGNNIRERLRLQTKTPNPTRQNIKSRETTETSDKLPAMDRLIRRFQNYTAPCITHNPNQNPEISYRRISDEVDQEYTADEREIAAKFY